MEDEENVSEVNGNFEIQFHDLTYEQIRKLLDDLRSIEIKYGKDRFRFRTSFSTDKHWNLRNLKI